MCVGWQCRCFNGIADSETLVFQHNCTASVRDTAWNSGARQEQLHLSIEFSKQNIFWCMLKPVKLHKTVTIVLNMFRQIWMGICFLLLDFKFREQLPLLDNVYWQHTCFSDIADSKTPVFQHDCASSVKDTAWISGAREEWLFLSIKFSK